jgi:hypothetical protein
MPESRNSGMGSEVDFLGNELLRQLHGNGGTQLFEKVFSRSVGEPVKDLGGEQN